MKLLVIALILAINLLNLNQNVAQNVETCGVLNEKLLYEDKSSTAPNEYPWTALIGYRNVGHDRPVYYRCQGVLLSKRIVITTHHCLDEIDITEVFLGDWNATIRQIYEVDEIILHPGYQLTREPPRINDVGMLHLSRDVQFSLEVQPICLPPDDLKNTDFVAKRLFAAGINKTLLISQNTEEFEKIKFQVQVMSLQYCRELMKPQVDYQHHLCGFVDSGTGIGLSGAGLLDVKVVDGQPKHFYLIGLLAFRYRGANSDGYTSIIPHLRWIKQNLN